MNHNLLKGKNGLILGIIDYDSIAYHVALQCIKEGANIIISNNKQAIKYGFITKISKDLSIPIIEADLTNYTNVEKLINNTLKLFNSKIDFILHSVGISYNIRKKNDYIKHNLDYYFNTLNVSSLSLHRILSVCFQKDAISCWGSVVTLTYYGSKKVLPEYNDMGDAKSLLESIVRNFGYYYGVNKRVRINAISQSPVITKSSIKINNFNTIVKNSNSKSPLGNANSDMCAKYCVTLFSDYTRMVTMQTLFHDGGFSSMII
ncbi:MAG: SDR family oxidoreductase [Bacteroides sp.]|nr:MAG: SDR family oxidoreductase [Bacteroides sp.]